MPRLGRLWRGPEVTDGDESSEQAHTLHLIVRAGFVVLALALVISVALRPESPRAHLEYVLMLLSHGITLLVLRRGHLRVAVAIHATLYLAIVVVGMYVSGGIHSPAGFVLPPIVLLVGLTWSGRAALVTAVAASLAGLGLIVLERRGQLPPAHEPESERLWMVATVALVITAVILLVALDIIRRSRARLAANERERRVLEEHLAGSRRLELVGKLAAGVAHDFNNLLTVIFINTDRIARSKDTRAAAAATEIRETADLAAALVRQLLAFGRRQVIESQLLDVSVVTRDLEKLLCSMGGRRAELVLDLGRGLGHVRADRTQVEQVLMNLVGNAFDAMPQGGKVTVTTAPATPEQLARAHLPAAAHGAICLSVTDTGQGMDAEVVARVFEPFFTTKPFGKGTGLGLATVRSIVAHCGGEVVVDSAPGRGSTFLVLLPVAAPVPAPAVATVTSAPVAAPVPAARVLIVDDDDGVRDAAASILNEQHRVSTASSGAEALATLTGDDPPALLLTDLAMADMSGPELARRLRERVPQLRVLFMSGQAGDAISERGVIAEGVHFIAKPFEGESLIDKVDSVLAGQAPGELGPSGEKTTPPTTATFRG